MELLRQVGGLRCGSASLRRRPRAAPILGNHNVSPVPLQPLFLLLSRGLRDYPIKLLMRNHNLQKKSVEIEKEWSFGIVLEPSEVKSLRSHNGDISAASAEFFKGELFLHNMHIPVWRSGLIGRPAPTRERKLLANRSELKRLEAFMKEPTAQLLPVRVEVGNTGWIKVIMAQCYKKNKVDNRQRDEERDVKRQLRDW